MINLLIGLAIGIEAGTFIGVVIMCLFQITKKS
ncbi:MAG: DUF3789 domain-containing protein [Acutalibacteraceae bacterium]